MAARAYRGFLLALGLGALSLVAACGGGGETRSATPTFVAGSTKPPPYATFTARFEASLIFFLRGGDLWIASVDGTTVPPRAITSGAIKSGFSGLVKRADGSQDIYYVVQESDQRTAEDRYVADFTLYRVPLAGGEPEEIIRFTGRPAEPFITPNAAVSPDGKTVLYADDEGIARLDLASKRSARLLTDSPPCGSPAGCFAYHHPQWSPDGTRALVIKSFWEGARDILIDPFASSITEVSTDGGSSFPARWSPNGATACVSQNTYANAGAAMVYNVASRASTDATLQLDLPTPTEQGRLRIDTRGCAQAADGRLAFGYIAPDDYENVRIAIVDSSYAVLSRSEPVPDPSDVVAWLPDGSGVLFNRQAPTTGEPLPPGIYRPDVGVSDLPFATDWILAVVP